MTLQAEVKTLHPSNEELETEGKTLHDKLVDVD